MDFVKELWLFLRSHRKYWLMPVILFLLTFGGLILLTEGTAVAPFVYTVF